MHWLTFLTLGLVAALAQPALARTEAVASLRILAPIVTDLTPDDGLASSFDIVSSGLVRGFAKDSRTPGESFESTAGAGSIARPLYTVRAGWEPNTLLSAEAAVEDLPPDNSRHDFNGRAWAWQGWQIRLAPNTRMDIHVEIDQRVDVAGFGTAHVQSGIAAADVPNPLSAVADLHLHGGDFRADPAALSQTGFRRTYALQSGADELYGFVEFHVDANVSRTFFSVSEVPEPSTLLLLALGTAVVLSRRSSLNGPSAAPRG